MKYGDAEFPLAKAASILHRKMLSHKPNSDVTFHNGCIEEGIPPSLLEFVCIIEHGAGIKSHSKSDLTLSQRLEYNCFAKYKEGAKAHRHSKDRETPFAVYIGLTVFAKTRKRQLIDVLHENGISISYDRVLEISAQLGDEVVT